MKKIKLAEFIINKVWRPGGKLMRALSARVTSEHQLEASALEEKMKDAIEKLKASGVHSGYRGAAALYALPWYMIIGPSAAGKSALLRNSNLHFPYSVNDQIDIMGFAGTHNCDWWFADEAIILDTAGRYTADESDKPEWLALLQLLRKYRRRSPINGVIVTLSLEEIIQSDKQSILNHMQLVRQKLDELNHELGIVIPVHLIVTQCDLLEGFTHFFKDLSPGAREQPWGLRLQGTSFKEGAAALIENLCDSRIQKIAMTPIIEHKHAIMAFPMVFEEALNKIVFFVEGLVAKNHYQEQPSFQGVYFTSAKQENSPHSYFIKDLFRKIIFQQKEIKKNARQTKLGKRLKFAASVAGMALCLSAGTLLESGYQTQQELYSKQEILVKQLGTRSSYEQLTGLLKIHQHYTALNEMRDKNLWRFALGINSLNAQIKDVESLFAAYFAPFMAAPAIKSLEYILENGTKQWSSLSPQLQSQQYIYYYDQLKTYLMIGTGQNFDPVFAAENLNAAWEHYIKSLQPAIPVALSATSTELMFRDFLSLMKAGKIKQNLPGLQTHLVHNARDALYMPPDPKLLYQHLMSRGTQELGMVSVQDILAGQDQGILINRYPMPKMFTHAAFESAVLPMMHAIAANAGTGDWVFQDNADSLDKNAQKKWVHELRALYFMDYAQHWMNWLAHMEVKPFHSLDDASSKLLRIARENGPLFAVIREFNANLNWGAPELKTVNDEIAQMNDPEIMKQYLSQIAVIQSDMAALIASSDPLRDADIFARKVLAESGQTSLSSAMNAMHGLNNLGPEPKRVFISFLRSPIEQSWRTILQAAGSYIQQLWDSEVTALYNQSLRGKFPFSKTHTEVAVDDVSHFFNPKDGVLSEFQNTVLKPYLKPAKNGWTEQQWLGQGIGFSRVFLNALTQGEQITQALFRAGSTDPKFTFYIQPVATPGIEEIIFDTNGQEYRYRNEPEEWRRFTWPGDATQIGARLYAASNQNRHTAEIEHHGLWGLFHLLSHAKFSRQGGTQYLTEWTLQDHAGESLSVKMKIKADKQSNVLDPRVLTQFKLPDLIRGDS